MASAMRAVCWLVIAALAGGCSVQDDKAAPAKGAKPVIKIAVYQSGRLVLDGKESTLEEADRSLAELESKGGEVWYFREAANDEPPAIAMQVLALVLKHKMPITLSTKSDYSDYVDNKGVSRPRK
jgi:hypothetical protein